MSADIEMIGQGERAVADVMTAVEIRAQVNRIQEIMRAVMKNGVHYGTVPGCGDKPTLLKPGAEKILSTFHIAVDPQVDSEVRNEDEYTVRIKAVASSGGRELGAAFGEASSMEEKYKWRRAICDEEFEETPEDRRREAFKKYQGKISRVKQIRTQVSDIANTVLKMAVKRAEVAVCLKVTAASDIFTQDIEDLPEGIAEEQGPPPVKMPERKSAEQQHNRPSENHGQEIKGTLTKIARKEGNKNGKAYTRYGLLIVNEDGETWVNTFDDKIAEEASELMDAEVSVLVKKNQYGYDVLNITLPETPEANDEANDDENKGNYSPNEVPLPF